MSRLAILSIVTALMSMPAQAQDISFMANGQAQLITQSGSVDAALAQSFNQPGGACDALCIAPDTVNRNIPTIGETEVISFLTATVADGQGLLIDARTEEGRARGYIAASINIPHALLADDNPFAKDILVAMGATETNDGLDFTSALPVVVFDDGPTTDDAELLITALTNADYPVDKIRYYRGGMLVWSALGLSVAQP